MRAQCRGRSQPFDFANAIESHAEKITPRRIFRRRLEIKPIVCVVDFRYISHIKVARRNTLHVAAVARYAVDMSPAVTFAGPKESRTAIDPLSIAPGQSGFVPIDIAPGDIDPGIVFFCKYRADLTGASVAKHDRLGIL